MLRIPVYNQYNDPLPDGMQDPDASTDCGEECIAMVGAAYGYGGIPGFMAGQVRVIMRRGLISGLGTSTAEDIKYGLWACFRLGADVLYEEQSKLQGSISDALNARQPVIALGNWDGVPHWVVVSAVNSEGWTEIDPAGGIVRGRRWLSVFAAYLGAIVVLHEGIPAVL